MNWLTYVENGPVSLEPQEQVDLCREAWMFWKMQLLRILNAVSPGDAANTNLYLRKAVEKMKPRGPTAFSATLAGLFKQVCAEHQVDAALAEGLDNEDLAGYESDVSLDEEDLRSLPESRADAIRDMLRRSKIHSLSPEGRSQDVKYNTDLQEACRRSIADGEVPKVVSPLTSASKGRSRASA